MTTDNNSDYLFILASGLVGGIRGWVGVFMHREKAGLLCISYWIQAP